MSRDYNASLVVSTFIITDELPFSVNSYSYERLFLWRTKALGTRYYRSLSNSHDVIVLFFKWGASVLKFSSTLRIYANCAAISKKLESLNLHSLHETQPAPKIQNLCL